MKWSNNFPVIIMQCGSEINSSSLKSVSSFWSQNCDTTYYMALYTLHFIPLINIFPDKSAFKLIIPNMWGLRCGALTWRMLFSDFLNIFDNNDFNFFHIHAVIIMVHGLSIVRCIVITKMSVIALQSVFISSQMESLGICH